jgi:hypothetical protein
MTKRPPEVPEEMPEAAPSGKRLMYRGSFAG